MSTQAAAPRSAAAAAWADLSPPLWEAVAAQLPVPDLLSLRQAWRGASQLANQRARTAAVGALALELSDCVSAAYSVAYAAATDGYAAMLDEGGDVSLEFLFGFLEGRAAGEGFQLVDRTEFLPDWPGMRCTYQRQAPRANVVMQAVVTIAKSDFPEQGAAALELEELRFLTPEGSLIAEYGLAYALDEQRSSLCTIRLSDGTGFGRLQGQPLTQLMAHVEALQATTAKQPMKTAARRWSDSLLLTAIHFGVILSFFLQA